MREEEFGFNPGALILIILFLVVTLYTLFVYPAIESSREIDENWQAVRCGREFPESLYYEIDYDNFEPYLREIRCIGHRNEIVGIIQNKEHKYVIVYPEQFENSDNGVDE